MTSSGCENCAAIGGGPPYSLVNQRFSPALRGFLVYKGKLVKLTFVNRRYFMNIVRLATYNTLRSIGIRPATAFKLALKDLLP